MTWLAGDRAPKVADTSFATLIWCGLPLLLAACTHAGGIEDATSATCAPASQVEADLVRLINEQRARRHIAPLAREPRLSTAAIAHSRVMGQSGCFAFECDGTSVDRRIAENGYRYGEARSYIGAGQDNARSAMAAMMSRTWSRDLLLDPAFRDVGVGYVFADAGKYQHYWTVSFANPANENMASLAAEVVRLTNVERHKRGLPILTQNWNLALSAQYHADFMARNDCFAHRCPKEPALDQRAHNAGYNYRAVAENIAAGSPTPAEVVRDWMDSPGHRANILHPDMREIGVGYVLLNEDGGRETYRHYWVQNFGYR